MNGTRVLIALLLLLLLGSVNVFGYRHDVRLQPIKGDCSRLAPLSNTIPPMVAGREWIIHYDSHVEEPDDMCEILAIRWDGRYLHTQEKVHSTSGGDVVQFNMHYEMDLRKRGFFFDGHGGVAIILNADKRVYGLCLLECSPFRDGHSGHVLCGTRSGVISKETETLFHKSTEVLPSMGIDLEMKPVSIECFQ